MRNINDMLRSLPWGALSLVSLYISLVSGVVVALQYEPTAALHSTIALSSLAPFGTIFRSLHFYSSQIFFLLIVVHFWAVLPATNSYSGCFSDSGCAASSLHRIYSSRRYDR